MRAADRGRLEHESFLHSFTIMKHALMALMALALGSSVRAGSAEQQVAEALKAPNSSVVHLWAPWCSNCQAELKTGGWSKLIKENPNVRFYFVSVWNGGDDGRAMLQKFEVASQPNVTVLADSGPRTGDDKIKQFLGLPLSWIPSTWIYKSGELRFALNYGEIRFSILQQLLADTDSAWSHKGEKTAAN